MMKKDDRPYHDPVLLKESVDWLDVRDGGLYVDCTFGGGGHSKEILQRLRSGKLFAFDKDPDAILNKPADERLELIQNDFRFIENETKSREVKELDGILADLGISSHQIDVPERGFSHRFEAPLDMRMDPNASLTAEQVLNEYEEYELIRIFRQYGELSRARQLAGAVVNARRKAPVSTTQDLLQVLGPLVPERHRKKFLSKIYQALRIEVNDELGALEALLEKGSMLLKPGGRMVIISYHSLEDRMVKRFFRFGNIEGRDERDPFGNRLTHMRELTRKPVIPGAEEIEVNPRARSAKLRVAERIANGS